MRPAGSCCALLVVVERALREIVFEAEEREKERERERKKRKKIASPHSLHFIALLHSPPERKRTRLT
jgi:hypothetical protein